MPLNAAETYAIKYDTGVLLIDEPYVPPTPTAPFRSRSASDDPMPSDFFYNVPVGSGMTYLSTSHATHLAITQLSANLNASNWTDPVYQVFETDPLSSGIEHRETLPSGWTAITNTQTMSGTPGKLKKKFTSPDLRVPTIATWQSTSNQDRKVMLDFMYDITLTITDYQSDGVTVLRTYTRFYPAGTLRIECHKWQRVTGSTVIWTTNLSKQNLFNGESGYTEGAVASGIFMSGYVREWEVAAAKAGDPFAIKHILKFGLPNNHLKLGQLWPARTQDAPDPPYTGEVPYGTHIVLPSSFDVNAATSDPLSRAFLWALKLFGAYVLIRAGSDGTNNATFGIEPRGAGYALTNGEVTTVRNVLTAAMSSMRVSANSNLTPGTGAFNYNTTTRQPVRGVQDIAGGGTRVTVGMNLADFDNATGLKLPLNPALYT